MIQMYLWISAFIYLFMLNLWLLVNQSPPEGHLDLAVHKVDIYLMFKIVFFWFQDFEEQLDMKDRLIKRLQDQIKGLQTNVTGKTLSIHLISHLANPFSSSMFCFLLSQSESSTGRA